VQRIRVLFRPVSQTGSTDLFKRADSNESFVHESDIATRQIRGCFDVRRMRLGQAAVDVIELHDSRGQSSHHLRGTRIGNFIQILILLLADPLLLHIGYILLDAIFIHCTGDGSDREGH